MMKIPKLLLRLKRRRGAAAPRKARVRDRRSPAPAPSLDGYKIGLCVLTIALLSILMSVHLMPDKISLHLGDISTQEVHASRSVGYLNSIETMRRQEAARLATAPYYDV